MNGTFHAITGSLGLYFLKNMQMAFKISMISNNKKRHLNHPEKI